jgi:hypothetical protein
MLLGGAKRRQSGTGLGSSVAGVLPR